MSPSLLSWTIAGNVETSCRAALTCKNCSKAEEEAFAGNDKGEDTWDLAGEQAEVGCTKCSHVSSGPGVAHLGHREQWLLVVEVEQH